MSVTPKRRTQIAAQVADALQARDRLAAFDAGMPWDRDNPDKPSYDPDGRAKFTGCEAPGGVQG